MLAIAVGSFALFAWSTVLTYERAAPQPDRFVTSTGATLMSADGILAGKAGFQKTYLRTEVACRCDKAGSWNEAERVDVPPRKKGRDMIMLRGGLFVAICAGFLILSPLAEAQWSGPGYGQEWDGRREHCERLRNRLHEIRYRLQYAQPWERERMESRAYEIRERLRQECWGHRWD